MTEAEWESEVELPPMLGFLRSNTSDRKRRLLAVAACRTVLEFLTDERSRKAVEVAEQFAEGLRTEDERRQAEGNARLAALEAELRWQDEEKEVATAGVRSWAAAAAKKAVTLSERSVELAVYDAGMALAWFEDNELAAGPEHWPGIELTGPFPNLIRDIFGPLPFRPVTFNTEWRTSTVLALAEGVYADRAFDRLPILADALQDGGVRSVL